MICVSLQGKSLIEIYDILDRPDVEMAEIRLDLCPLDETEREELFSTTDKPLIATCRSGRGISAAQAEQLLLEAIEDGATYIDLELEAPAQISRNIARACKEAGVMLIRSYHNHVRTPDTHELLDICARAVHYGANIVKIATLATSDGDWERMASIYKQRPEGSLVAFCMGEKGRSSRLECLSLGAPFSYASLSESEATAPGQFTLEQMNGRLYGGRRRLDMRDLEMPASKSFAQRAIIAAALAEGTSQLHGYTPCGDNEAAMRVARALGAEIKESGKDLTIRGIGPIKGKLPLERLGTGESGLLTRLMIPLLSQIAKTPTLVEGEGTLLRRPLADAADIMASFGVMLTNAIPQGSKEVKVPVRIEGTLIPGRADIPGKGGSQLISGLLMALPLASGSSTLYVHEPKSIPYMFITMDVLRYFGINISNEMEGDQDFLDTQDWSLCTALNFHIKGGQHYTAAEIDLEQDWSSAANLCVAAAIFGQATFIGLDTGSLQADLSILDILADAGACISQDEDDTLNVYKAPLSAFDTDLSNAPDLFPIVAVLAAFCAGESHIAGLGRLAGKESNRSKGILDMLEGLGVEAFRTGDMLTVCGHSLSQRLMGGQLLRGGRFSSNHDHRMVMALTVASLGADGPIEIDDTECVSKSFPDFFKLFYNE